ncbi:hypothetical protein Tco_0698162 [Tanacetum coccineum]
MSASWSGHLHISKSIKVLAVVDIQLLAAPAAESPRPRNVRGLYEGSGDEYGERGDGGGVGKANNLSATSSERNGVGAWGRMDIPSVTR